MKRLLSAFVVVSALFLAPHQARAEGDTVPHLSWPQSGVFGTWDRAALQRGYQVYKQVCSNCHSMKYVSFRNLEDLGFSKKEVKAIAAQYQVTDGPNGQGQMFQRKAKPSDYFPSPFPNEKAARAAMGGALPPDMSLLVKAREGGPDYIYAILTGYEKAPAGVKMMPGTHYNRYVHGHQIAMPQPLMGGDVTFADGSPNSLQQEARDVSQFLTWASYPHLEQRKQIGVKVILFLLVFCGVLFAVKRRIWSDVH